MLPKLWEPMQTLPQYDMILLMDRDDFEAVSGPYQVNPRDFLLCFVSDLLVQHTCLSIPEPSRTALREFWLEGSETDALGVRWQDPILCIDEDSVNPLNSFMAGNRLDKLRMIFQYNFPASSRLWPSLATLRSVVTSDPTDLERQDLWGMVARRVAHEEGPVNGLSDLLTSEVAHGRVNEDLRKTNPVAWRCRLMALARNVEVTGSKSWGV